MQNNYPQKPGIENILKSAFAYWSKTLGYQLAFSLIFLSVLFLVYYHFASDFGILDKYAAIFNKNPNNMAQMQMQIQQLALSPAYKKLSWILLGTLVLLYPLNLGFYKMYRKMDLGQNIGFEDLFAGYSGINFFIYTSFYLFWLMVFSYALPTVILGIVWIFLTLFSAPLMFFMDKRIFETIDLSFKAWRMFFIEIFVGVAVAFFFKYVGLLFFGVGFLFTFPFYNAMIYALYRNIFSENSPISKK